MAKNNDVFEMAKNNYLNYLNGIKKITEESLAKSVASLEESSGMKVDVILWNRKEQKIQINLQSK